MIFLKWTGYFDRNYFFICDGDYVRLQYSQTIMKIYIAEDGTPYIEPVFQGYSAMSLSAFSNRVGEIILSDLSVWREDVSGICDKNGTMLKDGDIVRFEDGREMKIEIPSSPRRAFRAVLIPYPLPSVERYSYLSEYEARIEKIGNIFS